MTEQSIWHRVLAPAKVNPFLEVIERRADGFHEIDTTLLAVELGDEVRARATRSGTVELAIDGPFASADIPLDERNLAWRGAAAYLAIAKAVGRPDAGVELVVTKNVPSQAGLGVDRLVEPDGHEADDVGIDAHAAFHFGHGGGR